jgi:hypothetical protein
MLVLPHAAIDRLSVRGYGTNMMRSAATTNTITATRAKTLLQTSLIAGCGAFMVGVLLVIATTRPSLNSDFHGFLVISAVCRHASDPRDLQRSAITGFPAAPLSRISQLLSLSVPADLVTGDLVDALLRFWTAQILWSLAGLVSLLAAGLAFCRNRLVLLALLVSPASPYAPASPSGCSR